MSQDLCEIFFSTADATVTPLKAKQLVDKEFQKKKISVNNISSVKNKDATCDLVISVETNDAIDVVAESLTTISKIPSGKTPYARYYIDQAGETLYYCLIDGASTEFSTLEDMEDFLSQNPQESAEQEFFSTFSESSNAMLVRLKIPGKKFRERLNELCAQYVDTPSDERYAELTQFVNDSREVKDPGFPNIEKWAGDSGSCSEEIPRSLCFCKAQDGFVFLGFNSNKLKSSAKQVTNGESEAMNMVISFTYSKPIKNAKARIWSDKKKGKKEWYIYDVPAADYMCFENDRRSPNLWP